MCSLLLSGETKSLWNPDWAQFWPSIIATLVGFFLAIVFQQIVYDIVAGGIKSQLRAKEQLKKIKEELNRIISEEIEEVVAEEVVEEVVEDNLIEDVPVIQVEEEIVNEVVEEQMAEAQEESN